MQPRFMLAKTFLRTNANHVDFQLAFGSLMNLFKPPFCLADPERLYHDDFYDSYLGLWRVAGVASLSGMHGDSTATLGPIANSHMNNYGLPDACSAAVQRQQDLAVEQEREKDKRNQALEESLPI